MKTRNLSRSVIFFLIIALLIGSITVLAIADNQGREIIGTGRGIQRNQFLMQEDECDCDGDCDDEDHEGKQPVKISGAELRALKIVDIAALWEIEANLLLNDLVTNLNLTHTYTVDNTIDMLRLENRFSPSQVKIIADNLKIS
jgi:hypothetical protein